MNKKYNKLTLINNDINIKENSDGGNCYYQY